MIAAFSITVFQRAVSAAIYVANSSGSLTIDADRMDIKAFKAAALPEVLRVTQILTDATRRS